MTKIGVLGAGTWGMALARSLCVSGNQVTVWSALPQEIEEFSATRRHRNLPGMTIPEELLFTKEIAEVCKDKDILLFCRYCRLLPQPVEKIYRACESFQNQKLHCYPLQTQRTAFFRRLP